MATNKDFIVKNGLSVGEDISVSGSVTSHLQFDDSVQLQLGTDSDLLIYHDGSHARLRELTGEFRIQTTSGGVNAFVAKPNAEVELFHAGGIKLATTATGVDITGNAVLTGELRGPASFVIDPAAVGNNTGAVVIKGDLTVQGTTTTVNSTTLDVADKNITLNHGSGNTTATADGAGITIQDAVSSGNDASILWDATNDKFDFSHNVNVENSSGAMIKVDDTNGRFIKIRSANSSSQNANISSYAGLYLGGADNASHMLIASNGDVAFNENNGGSPAVGMHWDYADGRLGIGTTSPSNPITLDYAPQVIGNLTSSNSTSDWNTASAIMLRGATGSNGLGFGVSGQANDRKSWIQSGHPDQQYSNYFGTLAINPMGGNVGIGITSPGNTLHITSAGHNAYSSTVTKGSNHTGLSIVQEGGNTDMTGVFFGSGGSGSGSHWSAITGSRTAHASHWGTQLNFYTHANNTSNLTDATQKMIITGDGNVGIGTGTNVDELLHIEKSAGTTLVKTEVAANSTVGLEIAKTGSTTQSWRIVDGQTVNGVLEFYDLTNTTTRMSIKGNGNVGIGNTTPNAFLSVYKDNSNSGNQFVVADTEGATAGVRTYTHGGDDAGLILNHYYAVAGSGNQYMRYADFVANVGNGAGTTMRFITKNAANTFSVGLAQDNDGKVGVGTVSPAATFQVGNLVNGETGNVIINSEGGNPVGLKVASRTNRARIQVADNDTAGFIIAEGSIFSLGFADQASDNNVNITNAYDVGIGTQTPAHKLDVVGAIGASQVRHSIRPSLNLDFANSKELDPRITFYRGSTSTYYDNGGILRYANDNQPRFDHDPVTGESKGLLIEETRTNVLINSAHMHKWPFLVGGNQIIEANAAVAPDGTLSATKYTAITPPGSSTQQWLYQLTPSSTNSYANKTVVGSFWARSDTNLNWQCHITDNVSGSSYNYSTTTEWQRFTFVKTAASNSPGVGLYPVFVGNESNKSIYLWGGMIEEGDFATSYIPSDTSFTSRSSTATYQDESGTLKTAVPNVARYGYKYDDRLRGWREAGLLLENATTQIAPDTEGFGNDYYRSSYTRSTVSDTLPNGQTGNCVKMIMNNGGSASAATALGYYLGAMPRTQNTVYNTSVFAKALDESGFRVRDGLLTGAFLDVNLTTGAITNGSSSTFLNVKVEKYAHGWWRISFSYRYTGSTGTGSWLAFRSSNNGNGSKGYAVWGFQITTNALASYIPNLSTSYSAVTQAADVASSTTNTRDTDAVYIDNMQYSDWYNKEEGTYYIDLDAHTTADTRVIVLGQTGYPWILYKYLANQWKTYNGNDTIVTPMNSGINPFKGAISFGKTSGSSAQNGTAILTNNTNLMQAGALSNMNSLDIGYGRWSNIDTFNGTIKKLSYYPTEMTSAELVALTENN